MKGHTDFKIGFKIFSHIDFRKYCRKKKENLTFKQATNFFPEEKGIGKTWIHQRKNERKKKQTNEQLQNKNADSNLR